MYIKVHARTRRIRHDYHHVYVCGNSREDVAARTGTQDVIGTTLYWGRQRVERKYRISRYFYVPWLDFFGSSQIEGHQIR